MNNPAIIRGRPDTLLQLGPSPLLNPTAWTQGDSDTLAHFLQVHKQVAGSVWASSPKEFSTRGGEVTKTNFPEWEHFVYAAVYLRQLFSAKDKLFKDACELYCRSVDSPAKVAIISDHHASFESFWGSPGMFVQTHAARDVFDAFLYGTYLIHTVAMTWERPKKAFREIIAGHKPAEVQFALHTSLMQALGYVSGVAAVIYQDFSHWAAGSVVPAPDVMWHDLLFTPKQS